MRNPDSTSRTRKQAWIGLLLLSATLAAAAWFGTYRQSQTERHAYARCAATAVSCERPQSSPVWAFAGVALALLVLAAWVVVADHCWPESRRRNNPSQSATTSPAGLYSRADTYRLRSSTESSLQSKLSSTPIGVMRR